MERGQNVMRWTGRRFPRNCKMVRGQISGQLWNSSAPFRDCYRVRWWEKAIDLYIMYVSRYSSCSWWWYWCEFWTGALWEDLLINNKNVFFRALPEWGGGTWYHRYEGWCTWWRWAAIGLEWGRNGQSPGPQEGKAPRKLQKKTDMVVFESPGLEEEAIRWN